MLRITKLKECDENELNYSQFSVVSLFYNAKKNKWKKQSLDLVSSVILVLLYYLSWIDIVIPFYQ